MNTVAIGDAFEEKCYDVINKMLHGKKLGLIPTNCVVHQKPGYYSRDRDDAIIFDISIEVWLEGADRYSLLWVCECKDYSSKSVPVDDVEEFAAKLRQVSGINAKGMMLSSSGYSKGARKYAESNGIALVEVNANLTYSIILHKMGSYAKKNIEKQLDKEVSIETYNDPYIQPLIHDKWKLAVEKDVLTALMTYTNQKFTHSPRSSIPYLHEEDIESLIQGLLNAYDPSSLISGKGIDIKRFAEHLTKVFSVKFDYETDLGYSLEGNKLLGHCELLMRTIYIDKSVTGTDRFSFILAHEIGHFLLHNKLKIYPTAIYTDFKDDKSNISFSKGSSPDQVGSPGAG